LDKEKLQIPYPRKGKKEKKRKGKDQNAAPEGEKKGKKRKNRTRLQEDLSNNTLGQRTSAVRVHTVPFKNLVQRAMRIWCGLRGRGREESKHRKGSKGGSPNFQRPNRWKKTYLGILKKKGKGGFFLRRKLTGGKVVPGSGSGGK